ncbi:hypothetical protein [Amycolatopsis sp. NPDC059657]|uniref:hypothetical protein n=1 Tax=Amycolatopsis sp. NPDC059657 TaxID=3346899 RepID=UPI00366E816C
MRRSKLFTRSMGIVLSLGVLLGISAAPANAATQRHFIHITTHGLPIWEANAELYLPGGKQVYKWKVGRTSGGSERWNFTSNGDNGGWLDVGVRGLVKAGSRPEGITKTGLTLDRNYCFQIDARGHAKYTGDSINGNCT